MGFPHWSRFMRSSSNGDAHQDLDWNDLPTTVAHRPWLVIDWNNFVMTVGRNPAVGTVIRRVELLCKALAASGARLCVVIDGKFHTPERTAIKLGRIADRVLTTSVPTSADEVNSVNGTSRPTTSYDFNAVFTVAERALRGALPPPSSDLSAASDGTTTFIWAVADGEADGAIRDFIRRNQRDGPVLLLSADASLAVGVPATNLFLVDMRSLGLVRREVLVRGAVLVAKVCSMRSLLERLAVASNALLSDHGDSRGRGDDNRALVVDGGERLALLLPWVACLLDGERSRARSRQPEDPFRVVAYLKGFLVHDRRSVYNPLRDTAKLHWQLLDLYVATVTVRAWWSTAAAAPPTSFASFVDAVRAHASYTSHPMQQQSRVRPLFEVLRPWATGLPVTWVTKNFHLKYHADTVLARFDGVAIAHELDRRLRDLRDAPPPPPPPSGSRQARAVTHHTRWCKLAECEPVHVCVEALLWPLIALARQVYCLRQRAADATAATAGEEEVHVALAALDIAADGHGTVSIDAFHAFLRTLVPVDADARTDQVTVETAKVDPRTAATWPEQRYTLAALICASTVPARGLLLPAPHEADKGVLLFRTCDPTDALAVHGAYCTHLAAGPAAMAGAATAGAATGTRSTCLRRGPLFHLRQRAAFLADVAAARWAPPAAAAAPDADAADHVCAMVFRALGLASGGSNAPAPATNTAIADDDAEALFARVGGACASVAACWELLPAPLQDAVAVSGRVDGPAHVAVATLTSFAALLGPWLTSSTAAPGQVSAPAASVSVSVVRAAATALLLSPFYTVPRSATSANFYRGSGAGAVRVDLLAPQDRFEEAMAALTQRLVAPGATRRADQVASLLQLVHEQVQGLLEDAAAVLGGDGGGGDGGGGGGGGGGGRCLWLELSRWFVLAGVQNALGGWPEGDCDCEEVPSAYTRACAAAGVGGDEVFGHALHAAVDALAALAGQ